MKINVYNETFKDLWDDFVITSRNGTFMQQRTFLNYHFPGRFTDHSLIVYDAHDKLTAVIPAATKQEGPNRIFSSHPGASHGGIVIDFKFNTNGSLTLVPLLIEYCREKNFKAIEIKLSPHIYHCWPCGEIDFALRYNGFSLSSTEFATVLPLQETELTKHNLANSAQRNINKAEKLGVTIKESRDYSTYWGILTNHLKHRHKAQPTHTLPEILDLKLRYPHSIKLFTAYWQGEMISGVLTFLLNRRVINCFYIASNSDFQHLRSLDLLFYKLINWGKTKGYCYLDWGISTEDKGRFVNQGLCSFKEKFGGRGILRETYYLTL